MSLRWKWTLLLGTSGLLGGMAAGAAWAEGNTFCEPGPLQGNPICLVVLLFGLGIGGLLLTAVGAGIGWFIDGAGQESTEEEPRPLWTPGAATRAGARYGAFLMLGAVALVWMTRGLEGWVAVKQHPLCWLLVLPITLGIAIGLFVDRRRT